MFSGKGLRSKVSLLSGGDYDGDMVFLVRDKTNSQVWICWEQKVVDPFQNADERFAQAPPNFLSDYFDKDTRSVNEVAGDGGIIDADKFLRYGLESSLVMSELGTCTDRHRDIVYARGYETPSAITLAHLASLLVDAPKQGLYLKPDKWNDLLNSLHVTIPEYVKPRGEQRRLSNHVMDILVLQIIPQFQDRVLQTYHANVGGESNIPPDADIRAFYERFQSSHTATLESLTLALKVLRGKWGRFYTKSMNEQSRNRDEIQCSPTRKKKPKSSGKADQAQLVLLRVILTLIIECALRGI